MDLGTLLQRHIEAQGSVASFARLLGVTAPYVFQVIKGESKIPATKIEAWADALRLKGADRERFLESAYLTRCPAYIQDLVKKLREGK